MWKAPAPTGAGGAAAAGWTRASGAVIGGSPRARFVACTCKVEGAAPNPEAPPEARADVSPDAVAYIGGLAGERAAEPVVHVGCASATPSPAARTRVPSAASKPAGVATGTAVVGWRVPGETRPGETGPGETRTLRTRAISIAGACRASFGAAAGGGAALALSLPGRSTRRGTGTKPILRAASGPTCATTSRSGLRVLTLEALTRPKLRNVRMAALRAAALTPPKMAPTTCLRPRRTETTRLKPEARVYPVLMPSVPSKSSSNVLWL